MGRYAIYGEIAAGGMAAVHFGRLMGPVGFARTVAIKRLHAHLAKTPEFVAMFLDEARLAARIRHPNVVPTLDVVAADGELLLVMDYVQGESLGKVIRAAGKSGGVPPAIASAIMIGVLEGLHAAHEARSDRGEPLGVVHRDVSPQNVIVGADGIAHVLDFGVAKATGRLQQTNDGEVKGKFAYMSPEQLEQRDVDRRTDVYASGVLLWETLTGQKLFGGDSPASVVYSVVHSKPPPPSALCAAVPSALDAIVLQALSKRADDRFATAHDMAMALEDVLPPATPRRVQEWVASVAGEVLAQRAQRIAELESDGSIGRASNAASLESAIAEISKAPQGSTAHSAAAAVRAPATESGVTSLGGQVAPTNPSAPRWRAAVTLGVSAAVGILLAGLAFGTFTRNAPQSAIGAAALSPQPTLANATASSSSAESPADGASAASAVVAAPANAAQSAAAPASGSAAAAGASAVPSKSPAKSSAEPKPSVHAPEPAAAPIAKPEAKAKADCSNPFTIDSSGRKKPRSECF